MDNTLLIAETYADIAGYIAFVGALLGWFYQWKKSHDDRKQELRVIWDNISTVKAIMEEVESSILRNSSGEVRFEIYQAHAQLAVLFRNLLARAIAREGKVTLKTISKWRKAGKLGSDWQQKCAMTLLFSEELEGRELEELDERYAIWEAIDNSSPLGSGNPIDDPTRSRVS